MADVKDEIVEQIKDEVVEETKDEIVEQIEIEDTEVVEEEPQPEPKLPQPEPEEANENGKMSSKSSDISIEEIGPEDVIVDKVEDAEVLIPEEPEKVEQKVEEKVEEKVEQKVEEKVEEKIEEKVVEKVEDKVEEVKVEKVKAEPVKEEVIEEIPREPERSVQSVSKVEEEEEDDDDEDDDDFDDETILERLVGLTEMFPEGLTHVADASASGLVSSLKWAYHASRTVTWIVCTSASIMFLPIMIETERMGIEEAQKQQQRQILLGPGAAMSGGNAQVNAPLPAAMS